jgi:hypothetical protein
MRRLLALAALALCPTARAEEPPLWTLQVDPLTTALGFVHLQVERALAPRVSVYAGPHARLFSSPLTDKKEDFLGAGLEAGVRAFLRPSAPAGWWAEVRGVGARLWTPDGDTALGGYASALAGYTAIFDSGLVLAGGLGVQYLHYRVAGLGPEGVLPAAHTTLGFAF